MAFYNDVEAYLEGNGAVGVELQGDDPDKTWLKLLLHLYADDTAILSTNEHDFQISLIIFNEQCIRWKLDVNISKTKIIIFGARNTGRYNFNLGDKQITITDTYHYLGVIFCGNGSFLKARKHVSSQANKALHLLFTKTNNADLPLDLTVELFNHTVLPILTYES